MIQSAPLQVPHLKKLSNEKIFRIFLNGAMEMPQNGIGLKKSETSLTWIFFLGIFIFFKGYQKSLESNFQRNFPLFIIYFPESRSDSGSCRSYIWWISQYIWSVSSFIRFISAFQIKLQFLSFLIHFPLIRVSFWFSEKVLNS